MLICISFTQKEDEKLIEKKRIKIEKPKSFDEFKKNILSEFDLQNLDNVNIYSIDYEGDKILIDNESYEDEENIVFKVIYDESL